MQRALLLLVLFCLASRGLCADGLPPEELRKAAEAYFKTMDVASTDYRKVLAQVVASADKIEVYLIHLNPPAQKGDLPTFAYAPGEGEFSTLFGMAKILKRKMLSAEEMKRLLPLLQATVAAENPGSGARCHDPAHAIRVWRGKDLIFESSICYACGNLSVEVAGSSTLIGLTQPDFDEEMMKLMPIPEQGVKSEDKKVKKKEPKKKD